MSFEMEVLLSVCKFVVNVCDNLAIFVIFPKIVLIFSKNFLDFKSDTIENQSIINLSSKSYASVVLNDSEVAFLRDVRLQSLVNFSFISFIHSVA